MSIPASPTVSILVPSFNAGVFVDDALGSVASQTFGDWEVVAADDASRDDTLERLRSWQSRDTRIRVLANGTNLGMTPNWNRCLAEARGELVLKLDADDVLRPRTLEILSKALGDPSVTGAAVRALLSTQDGELFGAPPSDAAVSGAGIDPYADHDLPGARWMEVAAFGHQLWSSSAVMTRRDWLVSTGGWDARFGCASDTDLILRLLRVGGVFRHRAYVGLHYRAVPGSVSDTYRREGWLAWEALVVYLRNLQSCPDLLRLSRRARQRRVVLWGQWECRSRQESWAQRIPVAMRASLEDAMQDVQAPPLLDRVAEAMVATAKKVTS